MRALLTPQHRVVVFGLALMGQRLMSDPFPEPVDGQTLSSAARANLAHFERMRDAIVEEDICINLD